MNGNILVATDFRAQADRAIDRAIALGLENNALVTVAYALDPKADDLPPRRELARRLRCVLSRPDAEVVAAFPEGSPAQAIIGLADEIDAGLIVIGPARQGGVSEFLLGTTTDNIIRHAGRPVLVVKNRPHTPYRRMVVATDFSAPSLHALQMAGQMFPDAAIDLVHAWHVPFERPGQAASQVQDRQDEVFGSFLESISPDLRGRISTHLVYGHPLKSVNDLVADLQADLVVVGSHGESGWRRATIGSMASALLKSASADTLMITVRQ